MINTFKTNIFLMFAVITATTCGCDGIKKDSGVFNITWTEHLTGDFSFVNQWSYPDGIYLNEFGQLDIDGLYPPEIGKMKDTEGRIINDSFPSFYALVDTTRIRHSFKSDAFAPEWAGSDYITARRVASNAVVCQTHNNAATHSSLHLIIQGDKVTPTIVLKSVAVHNGTKVYPCKKGEMTVEKGLWEQGILKAEFNFTFSNDEDLDHPFWWKGRIYTEITE